MQGEIYTVADVPTDYSLVTGYHEIEGVLDHVDANGEQYAHGHMYVRQEDGDYTDVLWANSRIPYQHLLIERLL